MAIAAPRIYEGTRIPSPIPTMLQVPEKLRPEADILEVNFGPNHPSTHGVLRLVVQLDGETVVGLKAVIGYLHTGFEKSMEQKTWWKAIPYAPRMDYLAFQANELAFVMAIEKLLGIELPPKAVWMRTLLSELNRIHSHLVWLGTSALELGAISPFWYTFRERDRVLDLFELVTGARMHTRYFQVGGLAEDVPRGFFPQCREFCEVMPKAVDEYESMLSENPIWLARTKGVGLLSADDALALGQSGPVARALRHRLGPAQGRSLPRLRRRRLRRSRSGRTGMSTTATRSTWTRCASRCASSNRPSKACRPARGSRTTARSCCRRARSCTRPWRRSSTTSSS